MEMVSGVSRVPDVSGQRWEPGKMSPLSRFDKRNREGEKAVKEGEREMAEH